MKQQSPVGGVVPHIMITDGRGQDAVAFYREAFGAEELFRQLGQDGKRLMHAHLRINQGSLMLHDDFPEMRGGSPPPPIGGTVLHLEVDDAERWWMRALAAGAQVRFPLEKQFWGALYGQVTDPFGYTWSIATDLPVEKGA